MKQDGRTKQLLERFLDRSLIEYNAADVIALSCCLRVIQDLKTHFCDLPDAGEGIGVVNNDYLCRTIFSATDSILYFCDNLRSYDFEQRDFAKVNYSSLESLKEQYLSLYSAFENCQGKSLATELHLMQLLGLTLCFLGINVSGGKMLS